MSTLLTSPELDIQLLFTESVPEVTEFLRDVVRKQEPIAVTVGDPEPTAYFVNVARLTQFTLTDHEPDQGDDGTVTVLLSVAQVRE
ncbi:hypothetical protein V1Y59_07385 [Gordonia sp. PKS22-38]|uniref:Uncharacterized protein n=1 Tax=Gordonia prachuapensis TaxID=3115651 RepID=A0ABU7MRE2_9ACTN|nr:hypothetical protein [Gordonia sp. PKS22-38]